MNIIKKSIKYLSVGFVLAVSANTNAALISATVDGNTWDQNFVVSSSLTGGVNIDSLTLDFRPLSAQGICFDTVATSCHSSGGKDFNASSVSGLVGFTDTFSDAIGGISGGLDLLTIDFTNFSAGEVFSFNVDIDNNTNGTVFGNDIIGALLSFQLSDGNAINGSFQAVSGNMDAAEFVQSVTNVNAPVTGGLLLLGALLAFRKKFTS